MKMMIRVERCDTMRTVWKWLCAVCVKGVGWNSTDTVC